IVPAEADGALYAGGDPGVLFESRDGGASWQLNRALWKHPTRPKWQPGAGGLCLHSIATWPGEPGRLAVGISAAGVWLTDDGGTTWRSGNAGIVPRYLPEDIPEDEIGLCVHRLQRAPTQPERIFMQFHGGVYRSDDAGGAPAKVGVELGATVKRVDAVAETAEAASRRRVRAAHAVVANLQSETAVLE